MDTNQMFLSNTNKQFGSTRLEEMIVKDWINEIRKAEKTAIIQDGKRKVHYKFENGDEMAEEYSMETNVLVRRAWRDKHCLRGNDNWIIEVGDPLPQPDNFESVGLREHSNAPTISRRVTKTGLEWRIRNLPYLPEVYSVTADEDNRAIVVRTSNKKYYKRITVPELERVGLPPKESNISFTHKFNTLIITYKKPNEVLLMEKTVFDELLKLPTRPGLDAPGNCNPS